MIRLSRYYFAAVLSIAPAVALGAPVKIKVIKASGSFFSSGEPSPTISWGQKPGGPSGTLQAIASRGPDAREFEINLPSGVWYFGASVPDGYEASYRPGPEDAYRSLPAGGAPITVQQVGSTDLVFSFTPRSQGNAEPANARLTCLKSRFEAIPASVHQEAIGTSAGLKVGLSSAFGGAPVSLELFEALGKGKRLAILGGEAGALGAWQSEFSYRPGAGGPKQFLVQASGSEITRWGFQASLKDLNQTDWSPLYPQRAEQQNLTPCFNLGSRLFDGQSEMKFDIVSTPAGAKVARLTKKYAVKARQDVEYREWQAGQAFTIPRMAAGEGNLRVYLSGPGRSWAAALRPQSPDFLLKEEGHCDLSYAKNDDSARSMRSECGISSLSYVILAFTVNGQEMGLAIANEAGRDFSGRLVAQKALACREPDAENPYPRCGNIEWHSDLLTASGKEKSETFKRGAISEYRMHYFAGSLQELADLGFTFPQGPRPKADMAFNMEREGSASLAINGVDGAPVAASGGRGLALAAAPVAPGILEEGGSDESPLASLLADTPAPARPAPRPLLPDITKVNAFAPAFRAPAAVPAGMSGRLLAGADFRIAGASFRAVFSHSGKCLAVSGNTVVQEACAKPGAKERTRIRVGGAGKGDLRLATEPPLCLRADNAFHLDGSEISATSCEKAGEEPGAPATQFEILSRAAGRFSLRASASGKCLDVRNASLADGAPVQEFECQDGKPSQTFLLVSPD